MDHQDDHRGDDVADAHEGHQGFGDLADTADATKDHQPGDEHGGDPGDPVGHAEGNLQGIGHAVDLDHVADTEAGEPAEQGEGRTEPGPALAQTVLDGIHRTADVFVALILLAVVHRQHHFGELGGHSHQRGAPHPEQRARAAEEDRRGHPGDVAGTDGGRQAGHQRLERADLAAALVILATPLPEQAKADSQAHQGHELQPQHQVQAGAENQHQHQRPPDHAVQVDHPLLQAFHQRSLFLFE